MRVMLLGDVCGAPGRRVVTRWVPELRRLWALDWVVANLENITHGKGIGPNHLDEMMRAGVDLGTSGNHLFARDDWDTLVAKAPLLRPQNLGGGRLAGSGLRVLGGNGKPALAVINLCGRVFQEPADCPFHTATELVKSVAAGVPIVVDFHAEATSEKLALTAHLDGRVAAVVGTHTHVQTGDERVTAAGTAVLTDLGMNGAIDSVLGIDSGVVLRRFIHASPEPFRVAEGLGRLEGLVVEIDGIRATRVARVRLHEKAAAAPTEPPWSDGSGWSG